MSQTDALSNDLRTLAAADLLQVRALVENLKADATQRRTAAFALLRGCMTSEEAAAFQGSIDEAFGKTESADEPRLD